MENTANQKWILFAISQFISGVEAATNEQLMAAYEKAQEIGTLEAFEELDGCVWSPFQNHEEEDVVSLIEDMAAELQRIDSLDQRRVIVTVTGGVRDYIADTGVDVVLIDFDGEEEPSVPERFRDLAEPYAIAVEGDEDEDEGEGECNIDPENPIIRVRVEGKGQVAVVEFYAKDLLKYHGDDRTWAEVGNDSSHQFAQSSMAEDYAIVLAQRNWGDGEYRADVEGGA